MDILVALPITFQVGDRVVHSPMVHAQVGGVQTKLILDSGASDHVFTMDLVRRASLELGEAEEGFDHVGASIPSVMLGNVSISLGETSLALEGVCAFDGPAEFAEGGIGGFLSPQSLHPAAWTVMDFAANELLLVHADPSEVAGWLTDRRPDLDLLSLERLVDDTETLVVPGAIEPFATVSTMLNTGSSGTEFAASAAPGLSGVRSEGTGFGVSGASVDGEELSGQVLRVGGRRFPVDALLIRDPMPPPPGQIGMDLLAGSVLAIGADAAHPVLWLVPKHRAL